MSVTQSVGRYTGDEVQVAVTLLVEEPADTPLRGGYVHPLVSLHHRFHATTPSDIRVPTGLPETAFWSEPFLLPFTILTSTPSLAASAAARSFGTIPPTASPFSTYSSHSSGASAGMASSPSKSPSTSERKNRGPAPEPIASAPAAESALMLYAPSGPRPRGATTGTNPPVQSVSIRCPSTRVTFPTRPRPGTGSTLRVGPSVPEIPTAGTPMA